MKFELQAACMVGWGMLLVFFCIIGVTQEWQLSIQWLAQAGFLWCLVWWQVWQRRELNRPGIGAAAYANLGWANRLTLLRGGLIALTGGFIFQPQATGCSAWIPGLLYALAAILDRIDGFVARRSQQTSLLGSELDTVYDALGLVIAPLLAVGYGKIHWSFLLVSIAYYLFQWGLYWRSQHQLPVYPLMPSMLRRSLAGFQMGFVALVLFPIFHAPLTQLLGIGFMIPILIGFAVDWLVVSGRIDTNYVVTQQRFKRLAALSEYIFQPALRLLLCVLLVIIYQSPVFLHASSLLAVGFICCGIMLVLGAAVRVAAFFLLVLLAYYFGSNSIDLLTSIGLLCAVWVMLLGAGRFSLWHWDDTWVNRQDGP